MLKEFRLLIQKKQNKAFSFVELLCAIVILALVATPILQMIMTSFQINLKSKKTLAATDLASTTCEFISANVHDDYTYKESNVDKTIIGINQFFSLNESSVPNCWYTSNEGNLFPDGPSYEDIDGCSYPDSSGDAEHQNGSEVGWQTLYSGVSYDNFEFNVRVICLPSDGVNQIIPDDDDPKYFTYDLYVEVFNSKTNSIGAAYVEAYNLLNEESPITDCPFNLDTIKNGCFDLITCQKVTIANKR